MEEIERFVKWAEENGWMVQRRNTNELELPQDVILRYSNISNEYKQFLTFVDTCIAPDEKSWFLCLNDYKGIGDSAYRWNEVEKMCLYEAEDDDEWKEEITQFWDTHLSILFSVRSGYTYYALDTESELGAIVSGYEPEFEETDMIASGFFEFLDKIMNGIEL